MTRNEQILSEVQKKYLNDHTHIVSKINAFIDGANWADKHPKPDMVNKQEFIEKTCAIYRKHLTEFNPMLKEFTTALDEAVNVFKKQLDE